MGSSTFNLPEVWIALTVLLVTFATGCVLHWWAHDGPVGIFVFIATVVSVIYQLTLLIPF